MAPPAHGMSSIISLVACATSACGPALPAETPRVPVVVPGVVDHCYLDPTGWAWTGVYVAVRRHLAEACACAGAHGGTVEVRLIITGDGRLDSATMLSSTAADAAVDECVRQAVSDAAEEWLAGRPGPYATARPTRGEHNAVEVSVESLECSGLEDGDGTPAMAPHDFPPPECWDDTWIVMMLPVRL